MLRRTVRFSLLSRCDFYPLVSPLETLPTGYPNGGAVYLRID